MHTLKLILYLQFVHAHPQQHLAVQWRNCTNNRNLSVQRIERVHPLIKIMRPTFSYEHTHTTAGWMWRVRVIHTTTNSQLCQRSFSSPSPWLLTDSPSYRFFKTKYHLRRNHSNAHTISTTSPVSKKKENAYRERRKQGGNKGNACLPVHPSRTCSHAWCHSYSNTSNWCGSSPLYMCIFCHPFKHVLEHIMSPSQTISLVLSHSVSIQISQTW